MLAIVSDNDVRGHVSRLVAIAQGQPWAEFWHELECALWTFEDLGLPSGASDAAMWRACQEKRVLLVTGNRNAEGPDSLESTIRQNNRPDCLPVLTLADPRRILHDRDYAELVVERLFRILIDLQQVLGTGRLFLP
jgi:hypothetical protein